MHDNQPVAGSRDIAHSTESPEFPPVQIDPQGQPTPTDVEIINADYNADSSGNGVLDGDEIRRPTYDPNQLNVLPGDNRTFEPGIFATDGKTKTWDAERPTNTSSPRDRLWLAVNTCSGLDASVTVSAYDLHMLLVNTNDPAQSAPVPEPGVDFPSNDYTISSVVEFAEGAEQYEYKINYVDGRATEVRFGGMYTGYTMPAALLEIVNYNMSIGSGESNAIMAVEVRPERHMHRGWAKGPST